MFKKISVLGGGAWGTALSDLLAQNGCEVLLWCYESAVAAEINNQKTNSRYLSGVKLAEKVTSTNDIEQVLNFSKIVVEAVPVKHFRDTLKLAKLHVSKEHAWILTSKGIELDTFLLPSEVLQDVLGYQPQIAVLSGPNFARDLVRKSITASILASNNEDFAHEIASIFENDFLRLYRSSDLKGVQLGGALKNIYALTLGIMCGCEYSSNTTAFIFTKCLEEMAKVAVFVGASRDTIYGLAGLGDLFLTGTCSVSKNFKFGRILGQGAQLEDACVKFEVVPEGMNTIKALVSFAKKNGLDLPICLLTHDVIFEGKSIKPLFYEL